MSHYLLCELWLTYWSDKMLFGVWWLFEDENTALSEIINKFFTLPKLIQVWVPVALEGD